MAVRTLDFRAHGHAGQRIQIDRRLVRLAKGRDHAGIADFGGIILEVACVFIIEFICIGRINDGEIRGKAEARHRIIAAIGAILIFFLICVQFPQLAQIKHVGCGWFVGGCHWRR